MEAAYALLVDSGPGAVSKRAVCARAQLNDRYFYESFANSDALLLELVQDRTERGISLVTAAMGAAGPDVSDQMHAAAQAAVDFAVTDRLNGPLLLASYSHEVLQRARQSTIHRLAVVTTRMAEIAKGQPAADSSYPDPALYVFASGSLELVAAWLRGEFPVTKEELGRYVASALAAATSLR
jgi:AcrR family transcriptional regulator